MWIVTAKPQMSCSILAFPTLFDRLAYRRVENDPRKLEDVHEPFDRLYGDLAMAYVRTGDYENAMNALKTAIRWNPNELRI